MIRKALKDLKVYEWLMFAAMIVIGAYYLAVDETHPVWYAEVYDPIPFDDVQSLLEIRPKGGGGTDFGIVFDYVRDKMKDPPSSIVILTDGYADFPDESAAMGIPVLWIISNDEVTPEWGKVARIGA